MPESGRHDLMAPAMLKMKFISLASFATLEGRTGGAGFGVTVTVIGTVRVLVEQTVDVSVTVTISPPAAEAN